MSSSSSERAMDSPLTFPATPGMALFPLSPGRVNRLAHSPSSAPYEGQLFDSPTPGFGHPEFGVPGDFGSKSSKLVSAEDFAPRSPFVIPKDSLFDAPSLLPGSPPKHGRTSADVRAMVSRFNTLDIKDHADLRRKDVAALKRAQMGREEAEAEAKRVRDEMTAMREDMDEAKERERRVAKRLDGVMEELHRAKEVQAHAQTLYEKEIRKARKEAFKSSSTLVKLQEELKAARNALRSGQSELELEKTKVVRREQETFAAQYQLVGVQEELTSTQAKMKLVEDERDALRTSLKEEEMQRSTVEAKLAVFAAKEEESFYSSNKKRLHTPKSSPEKKLNEVDTNGMQLSEELEMQKRKLAIAEQQIDFMKMECQFGCCACRVAENQSLAFVHDGSFDSEVQAIKSAVAGLMTPPASVKLEEIDEIAAEVMEPLYVEEIRSIRVNSESPPPTVEMQRRPSTTFEHTAAIISDIPEEVLSPAIDIDFADSQVLATPIHDEESYLVKPATNDAQHVATIPPVTPKNVRTITTTKTVPLADHSNVDYSAFSTPTGLTREQAIEQLRQRRGRARSVATTPKKFLNDGFTPRRDVSAPDMRVPSSSMSVTRTRPR